MISQSQKLFLTRLVIGLAQGAVLYLLYQARESEVWPATQGLVFSPLLLVFIFIPLLLNQALGEMPVPRALRWAGIAATVLLGLALFDNWSAWPTETYYGFFSGVGAHPPHLVPYILPSPQLFFFGGIGLFIAHALVVGAANDGRFKASYLTHFDVAWKMAVQVALAGVFVGAFWLLLWLGAGLFNLIKLDFFEKLITHEWFAIPATTLAAAGALHLTDIRPALVVGARTLLLTLWSWLLPVIALITVGFVASLPFTGLSALWSFGHASMLLLAATAALIVLINAAHQDGAAERMPPKILQWAGSLAALLTLPLAVIAAYALYLRVIQYGWTSKRVFAATLVTIALAHAVGYARAVFVRGRWLARIEDWNFYGALLTLALLIALFTPIASPARISVVDQMARLASGKTAPEKFDYAYLRREGGHYGKVALEALASGKAGPLQRNAQRELRNDLPGKQKETPQFLADRLTVYPRGAQLPKSFLNTDWNKGDDGTNAACLRTTQHCDAVITDLDGDGQPEIILLPRTAWRSDVFAQEDGHWRLVGRVMDLSSCGSDDALRSGHFALTVPQHAWKDIRIGKRRLRIADTDAATGTPGCAH